MEKLTLIPDEHGQVQLPEGFAFTPGEPLTFHTQSLREEEESYFPLYLETNENCRFTDEQFLAFSEINDLYFITRSSTHQIIIEMPSTPKTAEREAILNAHVTFWNVKYKLGKVFSPSGGFLLPDGAYAAPDASFVAFVRLEGISEEELDSGTCELVPNFVAELMSKTDSLTAAKRKMEEVWMKNGVETGLLIDPKQKKYYVYSEGKEKPQEFSFKVLFSCDTLPHFELDLNLIL